MSKRLNQEREKRLQPKRLADAKEKIELLGYDVSTQDDKSVIFMHNGSEVVYWAYSGWASGKTIKDGRGLKNLLEQLKKE